MAKRKKYGLDEPLKHDSHRRPVTRREFIAQGFMSGAGAVMGGSLLGLSSSNAFATLSPDLQAFFDDINNDCSVFDSANAKVPFICFDLAGGGNISGSNVLIGGPGGQLDFLGTAGYAKQGLPGDMIPGTTEAATVLNPSTGGLHVNNTLGLSFHSDSNMLFGILERAVEAAATTNGAVIAARSENDTGNNPHNPMYGINRAGANGTLMALIGSRSSESGGNSMAPASMLDLTVRPTKVDRPSDVTGLVDTGDLVNLLSQVDTVKVMESVYRISNAKLGRVSTQISTDDVVKDLVRCGYVKSADTADKFGNPDALNPTTDPNIVGDGGALAPIFTAQELSGDREFAKTASVMKLVLDGQAGAGTVTMGGYDYHGGGRETGERRDLRAGRCIGACLEYAHRVGKPLMVYVVTDGGISANGMVDNTVDGRGKFMWTSDNQQTAAAYMLVYNPNNRPQIRDGDNANQQIGYMRPSGDVETSAFPGANNVNLLVETVILNYMALHGEQGNFTSLFPNSGLAASSPSFADNLRAFEQLT